MATVTEEIYTDGKLVETRTHDVPDAEQIPDDPQAARIAELEEKVADLTDQATGKITKAQLVTKLAAREAKG